MTTEEKFNAAVNVIRNLPKNGNSIIAALVISRYYTRASRMYTYVRVPYGNEIRTGILVQRKSALSRRTIASNVMAISWHRFLLLLLVDFFSFLAHFPYILLRIANLLPFLYRSLSPRI